ncbi:FCD domain-containing protein [uncultured Nocardioides sp.]|uniref:FadR/GntR family transcriptional regulator n=1 Tax=uncultured Nocardioides sp. TaxID=198441 RepID=UPI00260202E9|nr:FCD domain-containing protein [uncultured Nocardioides sp.]
MHRWLGSRARSAVFAPIGDIGRAAGVERRLDEAIRSGVLADGERLPSESELASMFGVAVVTAREALVGLRSHGLITTVRGRGGGSFVLGPVPPGEAELRSRLTTMSRVDLADRGVHYSVVMTGCAELAAERATSDDVADLRGLLGSMAGDDAASMQQADTELHLALAALTRSARLSREVIRLESEVGALLRLPLFEAHHRSSLLRETTTLVEAVEQRDPDAARDAMRLRVRRALEDLAELRTGVR